MKATQHTPKALKTQSRHKNMKWQNKLPRQVQKKSLLMTTFSIKLHAFQWWLRDENKKKLNVFLEWWDVYLLKNWKLTYTATLKPLWWSKNPINKYFYLSSINNKMKNANTHRQALQIDNNN